MRWLVASMLMIACGGEDAVPPEPCGVGQHRSEGHCCDPGHEWVPARRSCLCVDFVVCGPSPVAPVAAGEATEASPEAESPSTCLGHFEGRVTGFGGFRASIRLDLKEPSEPSVDDPEGGRCGEVFENWGRDGTCRMHLRRCSLTHDRLVAVGQPLGLSDCDPPTSVEITCDADGLSYERREGRFRIEGDAARCDAED